MCDLQGRSSRPGKGRFKTAFGYQKLIISGPIRWRVVLKQKLRFQIALCCLSRCGPLQWR